MHKGLKIVHNLEKIFTEIFIKNAPKLHGGFKNFLEKNASYIALVMGILALLTVWSLWKWIRSANKLVDYANHWAAQYGTEPTAEKVSFFAWVGLGIILVQAIFFLKAFRPLQERKKRGWNFIFYAMLLDLAYAVAVTFTDYSGVNSLIWSLLWSALGFYLLFQVRDYFTRKHNAPSAKPRA